MADMKTLLGNFFSSAAGIVFMVAYFGSFPLAIIFGDKWDVVLSVFIPTYGFWVMIGEVFF